MSDSSELTQQEFISVRNFVAKAFDPHGEPGPFEFIGAERLLSLGLIDVDMVKTALEEVQKDFW